MKSIASHTSVSAQQSTIMNLLSCILTLSFMVTLSNGIKVSVSESPVTCASNNTLCEVSQDNLINAYGGVPSLAECRQMCYDTEECSFITYYGQESFPLNQFCTLLKDCEVTRPCEDCVSETRNCYWTCGYHFTGVMNNNTIGIIPGVTSDWECRDECRGNQDCHFFTYFTADHPSLPQWCTLQSRLQEPFHSCESCLTAPINCENIFDWPCFLNINGKEFTKSYKFTDQNVVNNVTLVNKGNKNCQVRMLLVGGGGYSGHGKWQRRLVHGSTCLLSVNLKSCNQGKVERILKNS